MQIKHSWSEHVEPSLLSKKFSYQLMMRGALTQEEHDVIKKYKVMNAWLYSNREERQAQKMQPGLDANWLELAASSWHNAGIEPLLEISLADLLRGVVVKNQNPYFLESVFGEVCDKCEKLLKNLFDLNWLFTGDEHVTEIVTDPEQRL